MLSVPAALSATGNRARKFFQDKKAAEKEAKRLRGIWNRGERAGVVAVNLAKEAAEAAELLKPLGVSIVDAAKAYVAAVEARGVHETFRERYDRFVAENEEHWSDRYRRDMEKVPRWVGKRFMNMPCGSINQDILDRALRENGAKAATTRKARSSRVWPVVNQRTRRKQANRIEIMTEEQVEAMLAACNSTEETRVVALLLFAGIRPDADGGEITRLDWSDVGAKEIYVSAEVSKTSTDRYIPITPRLRRLLKGHPKSGAVLSPNYPRRIQAIRKAAGIGGKQDITRHNFGSHFLVRYGEDKTKAAMGHTPNSQTLFRHYRRAVPEEEARDYFR